jgi:hypothetical protein
MRQCGTSSGEEMGIDYIRDQADEDDAAEADRRARGEVEPTPSVKFNANMQSAGSTVSSAMVILFKYAGESNERMMDKLPWSIIYNHLNEAESHIDAAEEAFDHYIMHHINDGDEGGTHREDCVYCQEDLAFRR